MATTAQIIARRLFDAGCRHAFCIPGGEVLVLIDALADAGIRVILAKHENCAGFMGEGVHHFNGAPAILVATIGPGIANAANVITNALQDRVPMIALTGCVAAVESHNYTHQVFDHVRFALPITKAAFRVEQGTAGVLADKAVAIATDGRPGPVLLDVPIDVQSAEQPGCATPARAPLAPMAPAAGEALETARNWLAEAERPLVIAGVDVLNQDAADAVADFCRTVNAPLITTYKAKGVIAEDNALALGAAGLAPRADAVLLPLVKEADLIVLAGYDPIEMRANWRDPWPATARVVDFCAEANTHYMHQGGLNFVGHVGAGLAALGRGHTSRTTWANGAPAQTRAELALRFEADEDWGPAAVVDECRKTAPRSTVATVDSGAHRILLSQIWACYAPRGLLQSTGLCTMGTAVPLAIGRKLAEPDRPVVAFVGDAGLEMFLGELATLRDLKLSLPIVVFIDESLGLIELKQRGAQMPNLAVDFGATDFPAVARALGGNGAWVHDRTSLRTELDRAFAGDGFTLICAVIGRGAYDGRI
jgi:acetolactate synthase-1/2/3 large subunit